MTESTPVVTATPGTQRPSGRQFLEGGTGDSQCPACGFGTGRGDRFCRRCGVNLERWRGATGPLTDVNAPAARGNTGQPVTGQYLTTRRLVTGPIPPTGSNHFDLVVVGSGPAGQKGAIAAAKLGRRVAIVDRSEMLGGVSLHIGTLPRRTLREAVLYLTGYRQRVFYGRDYQLKEEIGTADLLERVNTVIAREVAVIRKQLKRNGVVMLDGTARLTGPHTLEVEGEQGEQAVEADHILIACGTRAARPPEIPFGDGVIDADQLGESGRIPRDLIVVGAGVIGLEFASMATALGVRVTVIDQRPAILDFMDQEVVEALSYQMRLQGAVFRLGEKVVEVSVDNRGLVQVGLESGKRLRAEELIYAAGRQANTDLLNLAAAGLEPDARGRIAVNEYFQSAVGHIYAAGDCIDFSTPAATMEQGRLAAHHMFGRPAAVRPPLLPYGVYTIPEISMVGRTEQELTGAGIPYETGVARYEEIAKGQMVGDETGMLKILFHPDTLKVLGVHAVGEGATEIIHVGQAVLALGGTIEFLRDSVFNYPSFSEAYKVAALNGLNKL